MEAEKIKQKVIDILKKRDQQAFDNGFHHYEHSMINEGIAIIENLVPPDMFLELEQFFKQPSVSVMPSEEEIDKMYPARNESGVLMDGNLCRREAAKEMRNRILSLFKEAPNERIPDVGETIKETAIEFGEFLEEARDYYENQTIEELFDLFKQRNK